MTGIRDAALPAWLVILVAVVVVGTGGLGIFVAGGHRADVSASAEFGQTTTVRIPIQGMSCAVCAAKVKRALQSIDGVQEADVSLERREARVRCDRGKVSAERLVAAIDQLGYSAGTPLTEVPR